MPKGKQQSTAEITIKSVILGIILVALLSASNIYLGLKAGTTISTSIPAVIIALAIFRLFRKYTMLEVNTVQTAAAAGEGAVSGIIFTIPALLIMHFWYQFNYWDTFFITIIGGTLGILIAIPIRRALLQDKTLHFPEGTAIGQVIKAGSDQGGDIKPILAGGTVGGLLVLLATGFRVLASDFQYWVNKNHFIFGFSFDFSPALIAAGYICGINLAIGIIVGLVAAWLVALPLISSHLAMMPLITNPGDIANYIWAHYLRFIGIGTMLTGGIWIIISLFKSIITAVKSSFHSLSAIRGGKSHSIKRTEKDIPINIVLWILLIMAVFIGIKLTGILMTNKLGLSMSTDVILLVLFLVYIFIAGTIFASVGGYFAGLVGASNSPVSGLIIASILILSAITIPIIGAFHGNISKVEALATGSMIVMVCAFIGTAATCATELTQLSKVGEIVEATPWKTQLTLIGATVVSAFVIPAVLSLLYNAYGIGGAFPRPNMPVSQMLPAPQAAIIATISQAVFTHGLPWAMLILGMAVGVVCIFIDEFLKRKYNKRLLVLAVGLGLYLPMGLALSLAIGGFLSLIIQKVNIKRGIPIKDKEGNQPKNMHNALLLACGLVAGATIMGVILAIPFAIFKSSDILRLVPKGFNEIAGPISFIVFAALCYWIYKVGTKK